MSLRQRKEVQEMLRSLILATVFVSGAGAAILPDQLGPHHRASSEPVQIADNRELWDEAGFQTAERATYGPFQVIAYQFKDSTGAYAARQWLSASDSHVFTLGNYAITCGGKCPPAARLTEWLAASPLPKLTRSAYPNLEGYLPRKDIIAGSKRYILGPVSLSQFEPRIPAPAAAFDFSTEGQLARYRGPKGDETMAIFSYPTLQMARQQEPIFQKVAGAWAKRTGSLVAIVLGAPDQVSAGRLLAQVNYQASVSWDEQVVPLVMKPETAGQMLLAIFTLAALVLGFCVLSGLLFGAGRLVARKFGYSDAQYALTTLHLNDKITPRISPR